MDDLTPRMRRILARKDARRAELAALPWPEKVRIVVAMQRMAAPLLRARGIEPRVWDLGPRARGTPSHREDS